MFRTIQKTVGRRWCQKLCIKEFQNQLHNSNERAVEYRFLFEQLVEIAPATVLDIGSGTTAIPAVIASCGIVVTAVDNIKDFWPKGMFNRHFHVVNDDITATKLVERFDLISCISVLEHIQNHEAAVDAMFRLLKPGGHLVLTCPYNERKYCPNVYKLPDSDAYHHAVPYICQSFSSKELEKWVTRNEATILKQEYWKYYSGEFWSCNTRLHKPQKVDSNVCHQITCLLMKKADRSFSP